MGNYYEMKDTQSMPEKVLSIVKILATSFNSLNKATLAVASLLFWTPNLE